MLFNNMNVGIIIARGQGDHILDYTRRISEYFSNPNVYMIFSDEHPILARFINKCQYRKCIVYHLGSKPKHQIGHYPTRGGFTSYEEIEAAIREVCDVIID